MAATDNARSSHDTWGGWGGGKDTVTQQTAVAVVNQYIASNAGDFEGLLVLCSACAAPPAALPVLLHLPLT